MSRPRWKSAPPLIGSWRLPTWLARTRANKARIVELYDERFFRMWEFYLAGGIVGFENATMCNYQIQYIRDRNALPITRDYMTEAEQRYRKIGDSPAKKATPRRKAAAPEPVK